MRRTITMITASIGLVIAFVVGGVALAARPAAAGPVLTRCIGLDIGASVTYDETDGTVNTSLEASTEVSESTGTSLTIFPPDPKIELCGPVIMIGR